MEINAIDLKEVQWFYGSCNILVVFALGFHDT